MNVFITKAVLGGNSRRAQSERFLLARLLQEAASIADRLHAMQPGEPEPASREALADLAQIRAALRPATKRHIINKDRSRDRLSREGLNLLRTPT